jgi:antirestriction protein ArdC
MQNTTERKDVYSRITAQIVEYLEKGVRPWTRPWNAEHAAGRITRPLRFNGQPYSGINVLSPWSPLSARLCSADLDDLRPNRAIIAAAAHAQRAAGYLNQKSAAAQILETCAA